MKLKMITEYVDEMFLHEASRFFHTSHYYKYTLTYNYTFMNRTSDKLTHDNKFNLYRNQIHFAELYEKQPIILLITHI